MRVAIHCPYSLSRPGGVQGQVVSLARALHALGHGAVVLAPADAHADDRAAGRAAGHGGAPIGPARPTSLAASLGLADNDLVVLGRSVAVPANGSVAPLSLSPGAALSLIHI